MYLKRYGNREEVFNGDARQTTGGLMKDDLIKKEQPSGKVIYISKKLSSVTKVKDNFQKFRQKKKTLQQKDHNNPGTKTKKIKFSEHPVIKNYYYPELEGENLDKLRAMYKEEEEAEFNDKLDDDDDDDSNLETNTDINTHEKIEKIKQFNINTLDDDLDNMFYNI
jgi:hypothetical protein